MSDEPSVEALQQKLEEIREMRVPAGGGEIESQEPGDIVSVEATHFICSKCGKVFQLDVEGGHFYAALKDGVVLTCRECYLEARRIPVVPEGKQVQERQGISHVLQVMERVGVNVRRHGHLKLSELDTKASLMGVEFINDFLQVGLYREMRGLWIFGPTGTGKSQLAVSILRELVEKAGLNERQIVYDRGRAMITQLQDCYGTNTVDAFSDRRRKARLWIYEDAGTEKLTADSFRVLEDIFDRREGHPTIVTSNLSRGKMIERWNGVVEGWERLKSRIAPFRAIEMRGKDLRTS
jgi:hypothetical protein